jgi:hypothetical protein
MMMMMMHTSRSCHGLCRVCRVAGRRNSARSADAKGADFCAKGLLTNIKTIHTIHTIHLLSEVHTSIRAERVGSCRVQKTIHGPWYGLCRVCRVAGRRTSARSADAKGADFCAKGFLTNIKKIHTIHTIHLLSEVHTSIRAERVGSCRVQKTIHGPWHGCFYCSRRYTSAAMRGRKSGGVGTGTRSRGNISA